MGKMELLPGAASPHCIRTRVITGPHRQISVPGTLPASALGLVVGIWDLIGIWLLGYWSFRYDPDMLPMTLQDLCERGQLELMETRYLDAARTLETAEAEAWKLRDFDTLSRLYLPLQEARRQIRQRCGEGTVQLHLLAENVADQIDVPSIIQKHPHGQLLVAGWGTIQPAVEIRDHARLQNLYVETFLGAVYPVVDSQPVIAVLPIEGQAPAPVPRSTIELQSLLPAHSLILHQQDIPADALKGNATTFAGVMDLWERLHTPFLNNAANEPEPIRRMDAYRLALRVDPACELAHQFLADIARKLARSH